MLYIYIYTHIMKHRKTKKNTVCGNYRKHWLVVSNPLKNMSSSIGMMTFPMNMGKLNKNRNIEKNKKEKTISDIPSQYYPLLNTIKHY